MIHDSDITIILSAEHYALQIVLYSGTSDKGHSINHKARTRYDAPCTKIMNLPIDHKGAKWLTSSPHCQRACLKPGHIPVHHVPK